MLYSTYHLKQSQEAIDDIIEINVRVYPSIFSRKLLALCPVWNNVGSHSFTVHIFALVELSREKLDTKNTKYQPE